jgi:hypothetical protein
MAFTLHAALVPSWLQIIGAARGWLGKAAESGIAEEELIEARLIDDMLPFKYQVRSIATHSAGAIAAVREGVYTSDRTPSPTSFAALGETLDQAQAYLEAIGEGEIEVLVGQPMFIVLGEHRIAFTAEDFLLSFSQPNFYFHATTAYDLLRMKGVALGKPDFVGAIRIKPD